MEEIAMVDTSKLIAKSWRLTNRLRWKRVAGTNGRENFWRTELQQMSQCLETGEEQWEAVPMAEEQ